MFDTYLGSTWRELAGVAAIPGHEHWFLPYSPRAGTLRNVYAPPDRSGRLFASVEVRGLLRSDDGGQTWTCRPVLADQDIHVVTGHPSDPDLLYAALGYASLTPRDRGGPRRLGGFARSRDGGQSWRKLETDYTRAVLIPPSRPDLVLAAPAPEVGRGGRIVVSSDGGDTWTAASEGLSTPLADMVERFVPAPDGTVWAIGSGGGLLRAVPGEWSWRSALPAHADLRAHSAHDRRGAGAGADRQAAALQAGPADDSHDPDDQRGSGRARGDTARCAPGRCRHGGGSRGPAV